MQEEKQQRAAQIASQYRMRFYENQFPIKGELVMGQSKNSQQNGCYVLLLQYDNRIGMMPINQYSKTMKKAIHRVMKAGKKQILRVIRVDEQKGYIDLSKKEVNDNDERQGQEKYAHATMIHSIMIHLAEITKVSMIQLYQQIVWPLYKKLTNNHPLTFLKQLMIHQQRIQQLNIKNQEVRLQLLNQVKRRFKTTIIKTMSSFTISIKSFEGINAIKKILKTGIEASHNKGYDVKVAIIGAPKYTCQVSTTTKEQGHQALTVTMKAIQNVVKIYKGQYRLDKQPKVVGDPNAHMKELLREDEDDYDDQNQDDQDDQC